jgi:preprotein translocase subunit SecE
MSTQSNSTVKLFDWFKWAVAIVLVGAAVYGNSYFAEYALLYRVLGVVVLGLLALVFAFYTEAGQKTNTLRREAWQEVRKVVWPSRQETAQTTLIVLAVVLAVALVLALVDWLLNIGISAVLG